MKRKVFGFDLGIASVGWAVLEFDKEYYDIETGEVSSEYSPDKGELTQGKILGCGVRCFAEAENSKDGSPLEGARRVKRLARRACRRKARRMEGIKRLFIHKNLIPSEYLQRDKEEILKNSDYLRKLYEGLYLSQPGGDVWDLRIKALSEPLTAIELMRVLTHLAKHRGFKSVRKAVEEQDKKSESGQILSAIKKNMELLAEHKSLAQVIAERAGTGKKRNYSVLVKDKPVAAYINSIPRAEIERELAMIFEAQKSYGIFTQDLYDDFVKIAFRQRGIKSVGDMVGFCTFEKQEKRAPKQAPTAEIFVAWSKINNLCVYEGDEKRFLTEEERQAVFTLLKTVQSVKYKAISSKVFKGKDIQFANLNYKNTVKKSTDGTEKQKDPEDTLFYEMKGWHTLKKAFGDLWKEAQTNTELLDKAVTVIATEKADDAIKNGLQDIGVPEAYIPVLLPLSFDKFINLSLKALYAINPHLQAGLKYNEACEKAGYDFKDTGEKLCENKGKFLPAIPQEKQTAVPVVNRTVAQFRKVYNAMVREFGEPDQINIETGRALKMNRKKSDELVKQQEANKAKNAEAKAFLNENRMCDNGTNILKLRLYKEQECKCIYSGKVIDINRLDEVGYLEVDHILPYSRSMDNSSVNKVLVLSDENQKKGNRTPFEYIGSADTKNAKWKEYKAFVQSMPNLPKNKKEKLLTETFNDREQEFRARNANDNSYIALFVKKYLQDGIDFSHSRHTQIKNKILAINGNVTAYLRHQWGLMKNREESDKHHAQDAIVIACAGQGMVQALSRLSKIVGNVHSEKNRVKYLVQKPWADFRKDVLAAVDKVFVSRAVRKNASGEIHEEKIRTLNPKLTKKYSAKDVKSGIPVRGGLANNGEMLRTDVFVKKNKKGKEEFYLVPVYKSDLGKELPNKAIVVNKNEDEWTVIDDSFIFKFSLYPDDLIGYSYNNSSEVEFAYFRSTDRNSARIIVVTPDKSAYKKIESDEEGDKKKPWQYRLSPKSTLSYFAKYQVDPLGNYVQVKQEKRLSLTLGKK